MVIAIPLYEGFTALDAVGPYEALSRVPGARVIFLAAERGAIPTDNGMLQVVAEKRLSELTSPAVVVVPGGVSSDRFARDERYLDWIRAAHETSRWTTSVCTGAMLLASAGILDGMDATTHWLRRDRLAAFGARSVSERVVQCGKVITAAGVSAGIDMALLLAAQIAGEDIARTIQLSMEYDPKPPFDAGSVKKAGPQIERLARAAIHARQGRANRAGQAIGHAPPSCRPGL